MADLPATTLEPALSLESRLMAFDQESLRRACQVVGWLYFAVAFSHFILIPAGAWIMFLVAQLYAAFLLTAARRLRTQASRRDLTAAMMLVYAGVIGHSLTRLLFAHGPGDTVYFGILLLIMAILPGQLWVHLCAITIYLVGWLALMVQLGGGWDPLRPLLGPLTLGLISSGVIRWILINRTRRLFSAQIGELERAEQLEASEQRFRHEARHDSLTGMANRAHFTERLDTVFDRAKADPDAGNFAVLYLDLDRFKVVNDSLGHHLGDRLLSAVAARIQRAIRPEDLVARFGGDEFAVLLSGLVHDHDGEIVAKRLHRVLDEPFGLDDYEVEVGASIGIAPFRDDYDKAGEMLRDADIAMYEAKERRIGHQVFDSAMFVSASERLELEVALRRAIREGELEVFYQPIVRLAGARPVAMEALVRWRRGTELVSPLTFLRVAEETGLIVPLGKFVLSQAVADAATWPSVDGNALGVSVNLSARELGHSEVESHLVASLERAGLSADRLWLEITEETILANLDRSEEKLNRLRALGVRVCVDDFGVGYSSLGYLQRLPLDVLKLDRVFVRRRGQRAVAILDAIIMMGTALELDVVAEGLEEEAEVAELTALGAGFGQGYHFARPMPGAEVGAYLAPYTDARDPELD